MSALYALSATEMLAQLNAGEVTSVALVQALHARADAMESVVRGFTAQYREAALKRAQEADAARAEGVSLGPLHGLPVTIKENLAYEGTPATLGIRARLDRLSEDTAPVVQALIDAGAILLGKTNVPQLLLSMETDNDLWGPSHNPWNVGRVTGGSSGGEGALIASGISPAGIGTDIGGSIRIPAAWCGITGLKPTWSRWSVRGQAGGQPGQEAIHAQCGPMARTVDDLILLMQALTPAMHALDPTVPPLSFPRRLKKSVKDLVVGVYETDGVFQPAASVRRAVREAAAALEEAGATVIRYEPSRCWDLFDTYFGLLSADGFATAIRQLEGEPLTQQLGLVGRVGRLPGAVRKGLAGALGVAKESRVQRLMKALGEKTVEHTWALQARRDRLKSHELAAWSAQGIDVLLCPATVTPAALPYRTADWSIGAWHTMRYNLLDLPAGVVPVSRVRADEQVRAVLDDRLDRRAAEFEADSEGLPVAAQVVGRPWEEDTVLRVMRAIEAGVRDGESYPSTPIDPQPPYTGSRGPRR